LDTTIEDDIGLPSVYLVKYNIIFVYDRVENISFWIADKNSENSLLISKLEGRYKFSEQNGAKQISEKDRFFLKSEIKQDFDTCHYLKKIEKTIHYIKNGDIFQANITERFSAKYEGDPIFLYESLRVNTPNPFFAYLDFENPIISTSPERFFKISDGKIFANPIKGTVRCLKDGKDQRQFLETSEKNRAENIMIVDLMRNDLGRVCIQGTVEVISLCEILKFNLLYHLESIIMGRLKGDLKISQILKATFPGGSITGAPKIRAMNIIEELENYCRGVYTGAIGFFGTYGYVDLSIAIRVIYFDKDRLYFHAGGGIVVESEPEKEFQELMLKIESIKSTICSFGKEGEDGLPKYI
jgi:para-aminobenzoate synthetase component 1